MVGASSFLRLLRATPDNKLFSKLEADWHSQLSGSEDSPEEYYAPMMQHAAEIAREAPQDRRYGIFVLVEEQDGVPISFEGLAHINHAWPETQSATLRMVWNLIAPRYELAEVTSAHDLARIKAAFITEAVALCRSGMNSRELKVYLGNAIDRAFASAAVSFMEDKYPDARIAVRGGWLHVAITG